MIISQTIWLKLCHSWHNRSQICLITIQICHLIFHFSSNYLRRLRVLTTTWKVFANRSYSRTICQQLSSMQRVKWSSHLLLKDKNWCLQIKSRRPIVFSHNHLSQKTQYSTQPSTKLTHFILKSLWTRWICSGTWLTVRSQVEKLPKLRFIKNQQNLRWTSLAWDPSSRDLFANLLNWRWPLLARDPCCKDPFNLTWWIWSATKTLPIH